MSPYLRVIYDEFGEIGLEVYDMFKEEFREIVEEYEKEDGQEVGIGEVKLNILNLRLK